MQDRFTQYQELKAELNHNAEMGYLPSFNKVAKLIGIEKEVVQDTVHLLDESKDNLYKLQEVLSDPEEIEFYAEVNRGINQEDEILASKWSELAENERG